MWAAPDGTRTLFAPTDAVAAFVTAVYDFDAVVVGPLATSGDGRGLRVRIGDEGAEDGRTVVMTAGTGWHIPPRHRPPALTRFVEAPIARAVMGVRTYGVSPHGVREWYQATAWRPVACGPRHRRRARTWAACPPSTRRAASASASRRPARRSPRCGPCWRTPAAPSTGCSPPVVGAV